ncbi:MAG: transcription termination factor Rho [Eubacteriaceae bacterium]|nr:transcription termination factor Rho [Eubacteriaceae bacterium]
MSTDNLVNMTFSELKAEAKSLGIEKTGRITKQDLIALINDTLATNDKKYSKLKDSISGSTEMRGVVQVLPEGFGFLKTPDMSSPDEYVYVSASQVQKFRLMSGDEISGKVREPKEGEKFYAMLFIEEVNGKTTESILNEEKQIMSLDVAKDMSVYAQSHSGVLETNPDGFGFLRTNNYMAGESDIYVSPSQIRKYKLATGDLVQGRIRISGENERYDALLYVEKINGKMPEVNVNRQDFEKLVAVFPDERLRLETSPDVLSTRILDIFAPIGKGQRGMIVSSPKAGKTILLKQIGAAVRQNHPDVKLIILLIGERPEEVTDMQRSIDCDVIYSTFDQKPYNHIKAAEMVLERGKRLVESGSDVVVLVDSITRLARASNLVVPPSGRTLSGGLDPESLYFPKKFFGAARNIENGGSLTIIATALVETGSRMDDMIFEEFKGTGNMECHLERSIAESRIYPAVNIPKSGTRREDLLLTEAVIAAQYGLRKAFAAAGPNTFIDSIIQQMRRTPSNKAFIEYCLKNYLTN